MVKAHGRKGRYIEIRGGIRTPIGVQTDPHRASPRARSMSRNTGGLSTPPHEAYLPRVSDGLGTAGSHRLGHVVGRGARRARCGSCRYLLSRTSHCASQSSESASSIQASGLPTKLHKYFRDSTPAITVHALIRDFQHTIFRPNEVQWLMINRPRHRKCLLRETRFQFEVKVWILRSCTPMRTLSTPHLQEQSRTAPYPFAEVISGNRARSVVEWETISPFCSCGSSCRRRRRLYKKTCWS